MSKTSQADKLAKMTQSAVAVERPSNLDTSEPLQQPAKQARAMGRSHPDNKTNFASTTIYLERGIHKRVKAALLEDDEDLSVRVEKLLTEWLESREI